MTYEYEAETEKRRASRGAKVLVFGVAIFAVLGAFWTVVWFIRSYVEQPRIAMRAPMTLASKESEPAPAPRDPVATAAMAAPTADPAPPPQGAARPTGAETPAATAQAAPPANEPSSPIADRWFPTTSTAQWPEPANSAAPQQPATTAEPAAGTPENDQAEPEVIVASMEPAIRGVVPKPRPKPPSNSVSARLREPPLPRPRPDGSAPQSVWTATPVTDDRFPQASQ
jgi:hypothetical protein